MDDNWKNHLPMDNGGIAIAWWLQLHPCVLSVSESFQIDSSGPKDSWRGRFWLCWVHVSRHAYHWPMLRSLPNKAEMQRAECHACIFQVPWPITLKVGDSGRKLQRRRRELCFCAESQLAALAATERQKPVIVLIVLWCDLFVEYCSAYCFYLLCFDSVGDDGWIWL